MADPAGGTFIDIPKVLIDQDYMKSKLKFVKDQSVIDFWTKEFPASQRSNEAGEVISWVVSKFGPFISNDSMRNVIGQTKGGFNLRDIMDNKKILLVNLSKGRMGEMNSKLMGMIFVMRFQAAAMGRADVPENERVDFSLYVDEFQNFATDSFESILSEARKYRLNLIMGNQFMTQLTDKIREAIIGNVGTVISGRIGVTDAELMVKRFQPVFEAEDLIKMPNYQSVTSVMINNVPSAPFSMTFVAPMGQTNPQLSDALKRLSAAKYGRPRAVVEKEIFDRLGAADKAKKDRLEQMRSMQQSRVGGVGPSAPGAPSKPGSSFLDEWLAKRQQLGGQQAGTQKATPPATPPMPMTPPPLNASAKAMNPPLSVAPAGPPAAPQAASTPLEQANEPQKTPEASDKLHLRGDGKNDDSEIAIKLR